MPLIKPTPPTPVTLAFREGLRAFLAGPNFGNVGDLVSQANLSAEPPPSEADFSPSGGAWEHDPQQVFTLGLKDLNSGARTTAAKLVAWRYFAGYVPGKIVVGSVSQPSSSGEWKLRSVAHGNPVSTALLQSQELDLLPEVKAADYELRFLRIPGLNIEAFWLKGTTERSDLVAVFPAPPDQLHPQLNVSRVLPMATFLSIVVMMARQRLIFPSSVGS